MATNAVLGSLDDDIYLGFWINRSFGYVRGATITLNRQGGGLLIAFLALFVSASGRGLWKIARCFLHLNFSSQADPDGLYLQRQAILRNSSLAFDAALVLVQTCFAWRGRGKRIRRRAIPVSAIAVLLATFFVFAGMLLLFPATLCRRCHSFPV